MKVKQTIIATGPWMKQSLGQYRKVISIRYKSFCTKEVYRSSG